MIDRLAQVNCTSPKCTFDSWEYIYEEMKIRFRKFRTIKPLRFSNYSCCIQVFLHFHKQYPFELLFI